MIDGPERRLPATRGGERPLGGTHPRDSKSRGASHGRGDGAYPGGRPRLRVREEKLWSRLWLYAFLAIACVVAGGATFLIIAAPAALLKERLVTEVALRTGRTLSIGGGASLRIFPSFGISLRDVTVSAPRHLAGPPTVRIESLDVDAAPLALLARRVVVEKLTLVRPILELLVDENGRRSWDFAEAEGSTGTRSVRVAQLAPPGDKGAASSELQQFIKHSGPPRASGAAILDGVSLTDMRIVDGIVRYRDQRDGRTFELQGVGLKLDMPDPRGPLELAGRGQLAAEAVSVHGRVQSLATLLDGQPAGVTVKVAGSRLEGTYEGVVSGGPAPALEGSLTLKSAAPAEFARWLAAPVAGLDALGPASITGQVKMQGSSIALSNASVALGPMTAFGSVSVDAARARPMIKANLRISELDLNRLAAIEVASGQSPRAGAAATPPAAPRQAAEPASGQARSIEDLLRRSTEQPAGAQVRGFKRRAGEAWSTEPFDLAVLAMADLDGRFDIGRIVWHQLKIGRTDATIIAKDGRLKINVGDAHLYDGRGRALLTVETRDAAAVVGLNLSVDGVDTRALLTDAAGSDVLAGRGRIVLAVSAQGASERALMESLNGRSEIKISDGALIGWDIGAMLAGLQTGKLPALERTADAGTGFNELSGSFPITGGVGRSQDLKLDGPPLVAAGAGTVNIVEQSLDLVMRPKLAGSNQQTGGLLASVEVPVRIHGPWSKISVTPDLQRAVASPQAVEAVKRLGKQLGDGDVDGALKGILGSGPGADEKAAKAKELLRQFLNR